MESAISRNSGASGRVGNLEDDDDDDDDVGVSDHRNDDDDDEENFDDVESWLTSDEEEDNADEKAAIKVLADRKRQVLLAHQKRQQQQQPQQAQQLQSRRTSQPELSMGTPRRGPLVQRAEFLRRQCVSLLGDMAFSQAMRVVKLHPVCRGRGVLVRVSNFFVHCSWRELGHGRG